MSTGTLLCALVHVSCTNDPVLVPSCIHWYPLVTASCDDNFDDILEPLDDRRGRDS